MAITKVGESQIFGYTRTIQQFVAPYSGTYRFKLKGGRGGKCYQNEVPNYGGIAEGSLSLKKGDIIYVVVGGDGSIQGYGGYNGGGQCYNVPQDSSADSNGSWGSYPANKAGGGGGATHIARRSGLLSSLANYKDDVLMVAGGAGGNSRIIYVTGDGGRVYTKGYGGVGGGTSGGTGYIDNTGATLGKGYGTGGTQTSGGKPSANDADAGARGGFGYGGSGQSGLTYGGGGGGGWYGGGAGGNYNGRSPGGGGSGYINPIVENGSTSQNNSNSTAPSVTVTFLEKSVPTVYLGDLPVDALCLGTKEVVGLRLGDKEVG
ncbi:MAG: glycine-rich protein [bacterium]|nr:glycine-rich protein [bacterium]